MKYNFSKLEIAKNQLETAIRLYFSENEPVSIHTLASAAYNVIKDLNKHKKGEAMLAKEKFIDNIKSEHKQEISKKINEAENYFKHADNDPEGILTNFSISITELFIYDACCTYHVLSNELPPLFKVFKSWYMLKNKEIFLFTDEVKRVLLNIGELEQESKESFFRECLPLAMLIK